MKKLFFKLACLMVPLIGNARTVTTFDFTTPDADSKIYGVAITSNAVKIGFSTVFSQQNIDVSFTEITGGTDQRGPLFKSTDKGISYHLELGPQYGVGGVTFASTSDELITEIKFEYFTSETLTETSLKDWTLSSGVLDETSHEVWTGESESVTFSMSNNEAVSARIKRIIITTLAEGENTPEFTTIGSIKEALDLGEGSYVTFSGALSCVSQSSDCKYTLVSDGTNVMYIYSPTAGVAPMQIGEAVKPGLSGKMGDVDGVPCLTIEYESFGTQVGVYAERIYLSDLTDDYIGKVVKVYGGLINADGAVPTLTQGETSIEIHGITLNSFSTTESNYVEVVGVIGKNSQGFVIQPISVVASIYTSQETLSADSPRVVISGGDICIEGKWQTASVYDNDGRLIAKDRSVLNCGSGIFIVTADNRTIAKVMIR